MKVDVLTCFQSDLTLTDRFMIHHLNKSKFHDIPGNV